jgi:hypothetical protein
MDKYGVLLLVIVYFIAAGLTTTIFFPDTGVSTSTMGVTSSTWSSASNPGITFYRFLFGGFTFAIPGVPLWITSILIAPMYLLLAYFIYLSLPDITIFGISFKTKQP